MSTLKSICGRFQKIAVLPLSLLLVLIGSSNLMAQNALYNAVNQLQNNSKAAAAAVTPTVADHSKWGTYDAKSQTWYTRDGRTLTVGDTIKLGPTADPGRYYAVKYTVKFFGSYKHNGNGIEKSLYYPNTPYRIESICTGKVNGVEVGYAQVKISDKWYADIMIDYGLSIGEIVK